MKNKGFISTALLYTMFIVFLVSLVFLLETYSNNRFLSGKYKENVKTDSNSSSNYDVVVHILAYNNSFSTYVEVDEIPLVSHVFDAEKSYCTNNDSSISFFQNKLVVQAKNKTVCYAFFNLSNGAKV